MRHSRFVITIMCGIFLLASCGGGGKHANPPPQVVAVTLSPTMAVMDQGATQQFTASVSGTTNTAVVWSVSEGDSGGAIDAQGRYTAPAAAGAYHVIATSVADSTKNATAAISVNSVALTVSPNSGDLQPGETQQFTATVTGTVNHNVAWSVVENNGGTVSNAGAYTAPATTGTYHVLAKSLADASRSVTVPLTVAHLAVVITPASIATSPGRTVSLTATVSGCMDDSVTWAVQEGSTGGSISSKGVYVAPAEFGEYHTIATSVAHPSIVGIADVVVRKSGFTDAGNMTIIRFDHTATLLPNGDVLLIGGGTTTDGTYSETANAELFNHLSGTFSQAGSINVARRWHTATLLPNGKVLIAGGGVDGGWDMYPYDSAEVYDPATRQSTNVGNMHIARLQHTATLLANGKVLIAGGYKPDMFITSAELFDPETGLFTETGTMSQPRGEHTATLLPDGRVLILGGCMRCNEGSGSAEIYNPSTGLFTSAGSYWRMAHSTTLMNDGRVFTAGGYSYDDVVQYTYYDDTQFFSLAAGQAQFAAKMSGRRMQHTATKLLNGKVLLAGGFGDTAPTETAELFDPATTSFCSTDSMARARRGHTATLLLDGRVLITGGQETMSAMGEQSAELYTEPH